MQVHRFSVGELVAFTEKRFPGLIWGAEWEVVGLLEGPDGQTPVPAQKSGRRVG